MPLRIVVGGAFARAPGFGGLAWVVLQYVLGLRRLGHEVTLVEPLAATDLRPRGAQLEASENADYFARVIEAFGLEGHAALRLASGGETYGLEARALARATRDADLLIDLAGGLDPARFEGLASIPLRLYLDLDPGFTQLWQCVEGIDMRLEGHTHFATVGLRLGEESGRIPSCAVDWFETPQPVVLDEWPFADRLERDAWTTVGDWRSYGAIVADGVRYGQKAHSWRSLIDLPLRSDARFEVALAIDPAERADLDALRENGWHLVDPRAVASSPEEYRRFVQGSRGEIGVAKSGYVESRCGWFSDRSACYLASGRPVVAQETGFSRALPVGSGLFAFGDAAEANAAIEELARDYPAHRRAARALAEEYFDSDRVLGRLIEHVGAAA